MNFAVPEMTSQHLLGPRLFLGVAQARTFKIDLVVKKWQNQKIIVGALIYALCRFQNDKNPVGRIDNLTSVIGRAKKSNDQQKLTGTPLLGFAKSLNYCLCHYFIIKTVS